MKKYARPWCPACGASVSMPLRWARCTAPPPVLVFDLTDAGELCSVVEEPPPLEVQCGFCAAKVLMMNDTPLAAA